MSLSLEIRLYPVEDYSAFEKMCKFILEKEYHSRFSLYGGRGERQFGIDIKSDDQILDGNYVVAQCKNYINSSKGAESKLISEIESDLEKSFELPGGYKKFIVMTSLQRKKKIKDYIEKQKVVLKKQSKDIEIWFWDEIQDSLLIHEDLIRIFYPGLLELSQKSVPHWLTHPVSYTDESQIIFRTTEIENAIQKLNTCKFINLSGFGGVGKTSIARVIIHKVKDSFKHIAWINYRGNLRESIKLDCVLFNEEKDESLRTSKLFSALSNSTESTLFIIDNVDTNEEIGQDPLTDQFLSEILGWDNTFVVLTSRFEEIQGYSSIKVGFLDEESCMDIFKLYSRHKPSKEDEAIVRKIVSLACYHTLTIELLAKSTKYVTNLSSYYQTLITKGFGSINLNVSTNHSNITSNISEHLRILFSLSTRSQKELEILWTFAILPSHGLTISEIETWLKYSINDLDRLIDEGWLNYKEPMISMHPLVQEIFLNQVNDGLPENTAKGLFEWYAQNIIVKSNDPYDEANRVLNICESVMRFFNNQSGPYWAEIYMNLGIAFSNRRKFRTALNYYKLAAKSFLELYDNAPLTWASRLDICMNNIAGIYLDELEDYEIAEGIYRNELKINQNLVKINSNPYYKNSLAVNYMNLANILSRKVYWGKKTTDSPEYIEAGQFYTECIRIIESIVTVCPEKYEISLATALDNQAILIAYDTEQSEKAIQLRKKAAALLEKWKHLDSCKDFYIKVLKNLAVAMVENNGPMSEIMDYYEKAFEVCFELAKVNPELYGEDLADIYSDIGSLLLTFDYSDEGKTLLQEAKKWYEKNEHTKERALDVGKALEQIKTEKYN